MDAEEFDAEFVALAASAHRLETLPTYLSQGEDAIRAAMAGGQPRPERSVRTNRWLARIAYGTLAAGIDWRRTRVVDNPLTGYQRYQLDVAYLESQAVGEQIRIVCRDDLDDDPGQDFWLLDAGTRHARAILLRHDAIGLWVGSSLTTDPTVLDELDARLRWVDARAVPLNVYRAHPFG